MPSQPNTLSSKITEKEINFLKKHYGVDMFGHEICKHLNWSSAKLERTTRFLKLKSNLQKYSGNSNLKDIIELNDPEIIYSLGYIWADGYIQRTHNKNKTLYQGTKISIITEDFKIVEKHFDKLGKASKYKEQRKHYKPITTWILCDTQLATHLTIFNYHTKSKSSPEKILKAIPEHLRHYWWRGFLDGDGHITKPTKNKWLSLSFSSTYNYNWEFCKYLPNFEKFKHEQHINKSHSHSTLKINGEDALEVLEYIYKNYDHDMIGLPRKYDRFNSCKEYKKPIRKNKHKYICYIKQSNKYSVQIPHKKIQKLFKSENEALIFRDLILTTPSDNRPEVQNCHT